MTDSRANCDSTSGCGYVESAVWSPQNATATSKRMRTGGIEWVLVFVRSRSDRSDERTNATPYTLIDYSAQIRTKERCPIDVHAVKYTFSRRNSAVRGCMRKWGGRDDCGWDRNEVGNAAVQFLDTTTQADRRGKSSARTHKRANRDHHSGNKFLSIRKRQLAAAAIYSCLDAF